MLTTSKCEVRFLKNSGCGGRGRVRVRGGAPWPFAGRQGCRVAPVQGGLLPQPDISYQRGTPVGPRVLSRVSGLGLQSPVQGGLLPQPVQHAPGSVNSTPQPDHSTFHLVCRTCLLQTSPRTCLQLHLSASTLKLSIQEGSLVPVACLAVLHGHLQDVKAVAWHPCKKVSFLSSLELNDTKIYQP